MVNISGCNIYVSHYLHIIKHPYYFIVSVLLLLFYCYCIVLVWFHNSVFCCLPRKVQVIYGLCGVVNISGCNIYVSHYLHIIFIVSVVSVLC